MLSLSVYVAVGVSGWVVFAAVMLLMKLVLLPIVAVCVAAATVPKKAGQFGWLRVQVVASVTWVKVLAASE